MSTTESRGRRLRRWALEGALVVAVWFGVNAWTERDLVGGGPAPPFELRDLDGNVVSLQALRGKTVALHFWATWCGVCRQELGTLNATHDGLRRDEALYAVVADSEDPQAVRRFVAEHGIRYPVLLGTEETLRAYRVSAFPTNYFIGADGSIRDATRGMTTRWALASRIGCSR